MERAGQAAVELSVSDYSKLGPLEGYLRLAAPADNAEELLPVIDRFLHG
jgi:hypothetical protein